MPPRPCAAPHRSLRRRDAAACLAVALCALAAPSADAQQRPRQAARPDPNPDGSIVIEQVRAGVFAVGASVGGGRLRFRGDEHSFSVRGLEFGTAGITTISASGEVFNLRRLEDFSGRYEERAASQRPPAGMAGPMTRFLRNEAGVELRLRTERAGGVLQIAADGLTIRLR